MNRRNVLLLGGAGSLLAALGLKGCKTDIVPRASPTFGASVVAWTNEANTDPKLWRQAIRKIRANGFQRVAIISYAYVDPQTGQVTGQSNHGLPFGPTDEVINAAIKEAAALGLETSLRPWVEVDNEAGAGNKWRGDLTLTGPQQETFFSSYREYVLNLAKLAHNAGVTRFYIGSELAGLTRDKTAKPSWTKLITDCRKVLIPTGCLLSYAANYDEFEEVPFWNQLDEIGIDAYFSLAETDQSRGEGNPRSSVMASNWSRKIKRMHALSRRIKRPVFICEWGVVPFDMTSSDPSNEQPSTDPDLDEAYRAYQVFLADVTKPRDWLKGVDFWHWSVDPHEDSNYRIEEKSDIAKLIASKITSRNHS